MWTMNFQMFKLDLEKAEEPEIRLPTAMSIIFLFSTLLLRSRFGHLSTWPLQWPLHLQFLPSQSHPVCYCCSVAKSCPTLCHPLDCNTPQSPLSFTIYRSLFKLMSIESVMLSYVHTGLIFKYSSVLVTLLKSSVVLHFQKSKFLSLILKTLCNLARSHLSSPTSH